MDPRVGKRRKGKRMNVEGDRLSGLPDDLIHKILSFLDMREAIGASVLSSRWRFLWTSMPYLTFSSEDFSTLRKFSQFVTSVLSRRNNQTNLYSMNLTFRLKENLVFVKRVLDYAFCHKIQQLNVVCLLELKNDIEFPLSLFSSRSLKHLSVTMQQSKLQLASLYPGNSFFTSTWELPTLTTLDLHSVTLRDDNADNCVSVFAKCANLKNLTLKEFTTIGCSNGFSISHPRLSNLTLESIFDVKGLNVVTPQLKNLTIRFCSGEHVISAPDLASLFYEGSHPLHLSTEGFHSLEKADICVPFPQKAKAHQIVSLLQQLHNVKFLTLNLEIVEVLTSSVNLVLPRSSPFVNLKSLKIYPENLLGQACKKGTIMSTKLQSYLLDSSPGCTVTTVLREEIQAQNLMAELQVLLDKEKNSSKTNSADLKRGKKSVESFKQKKQKTKGKVAQIQEMQSCWDNLVVQIEQRKKKACRVISKVQSIKELLTKLPASHRAKVQPCFSSLCAEADIAISKITDSMKIKCDENQSHSSLCFHELATTL